MGKSGTVATLIGRTADDAAEAAADAAGDALRATNAARRESMEQMKNKLDDLLEQTQSVGGSAQKIGDNVPEDLIKGADGVMEGTADATKTVAKQQSRLRRYKSATYSKGKTLAMGCKKNLRTCAAAFLAAGVTGTAVNIGVVNARKQAECIDRCLPSNTDECLDKAADIALNPDEVHEFTWCDIEDAGEHQWQYAAASHTSDKPIYKQHKCLSLFERVQILIGTDPKDLDERTCSARTWCEQECETLHPTDPAVLVGQATGAVGGAIGGAVGGAVGPVVGGVLEGLLGVPPLWVILSVLAGVAVLVLFLIWMSHPKPTQYPNSYRRGVEPPSHGVKLERLQPGAHDVRPLPPPHA